MSQGDSPIHGGFIWQQPPMDIRSVLYILSYVHNSQLGGQGPRHETFRRFSDAHAVIVVLGTRSDNNNDGGTNHVPTVKPPLSLKVVYK